MQVRRLSPFTQRTYVETVARFARYFDRSPRAPRSRADPRLPGLPGHRTPPGNELAARRRGGAPLPLLGHASEAVVLRRRDPRAEEAAVAAGRAQPAGVVALVKSNESDLGSTTRCCGLRWHRQTTSVRVCSPSSRRLATLGPRFAGLTALTTAPRTLVRTGSCLSMPNPRPQDVAVDDLFGFVHHDQFRVMTSGAGRGRRWPGSRASGAFHNQSLARKVSREESALNRWVR